MKKIFKSSLSAVIAIAMVICTLIGTISSSAIDTGCPGDVNKDGELNNRDVVCLFRYLSGGVGSNVVDVIACDTTGDGKTNNKDITVLFRYLNGEDYEIYYGKRPEFDNIYILWDDTTKSTVTGAKQTNVDLAATGVRLTCTSSSGISDPYIKFNIAEYAKLTNKPALSGKDGAYIVLRVKSNADGFIEVFTHSPAAGDSSTTTYKADNKFHYVIVDMTKTTFTTPEKLTNVRIDWAGGDAAKGMSMIISEIGFFADYESALAYTKLTAADFESEAAGILSIPKNKEISNFITSSNATVTASDTEAVAVLTSTKKSPVAAINVRAIAELEDKAVKKADNVAIRVKVKGQTKMTASLEVMDVSGYNVKVQNQLCTIDCTKEGWQGVMFNIRDVALSKNEIRKLTVTFNNFNSAGSIEIGGAVVTDNINDALTVCEHTEYCLNYDKDLTDNDTLANTVLVADNEDSTVKFWFDQSTEKTYRNDTESTGRTGYTVRMAKNESENCQFFIAPEKTFTARIEIEEFKNASGKTVPFEAFYEYYHNLNNTLIPDAIPPLTGPVEIESGTSQGFVIQLTTAQDTPAGLYESVIHVYDNATGKEVKRAAVAVKVWDFELSEKTELRTAFALWGSYVLNSYNWNNVSFSDVEAMDNYFEFFLKYRINIMDNPHGLTSGYANKYMSQERVNTARWTNLDVSIKDDNDGVTPTWIDKVIYYPGEIDEPRENYHFTLMRQCYERIKANTPEFKMVAPFERNLDLTADGTITTFANAATDQIGYMSQYLNIWCPILNAFTTRDLGFISRTTFLQSEDQDAKYGTFIDRMNKEVEEGDELWAYVCINPREPYANWKVNSDGTETIVSLWQLKEYNVTGLLYWSVNYWRVNYWDQSTPWAYPNDGDGMLIYSGYKFGLSTPVSTLRLENIRDGIEDYQMLCMLENALGKEAADDMISRITTSVVTFANNDDYIHAVRVLLGDTLEEALAH